MTERFGGVITPLLTPYNDDGSIARDLYLAHAADCLAKGAHYLSPFGTSGEALSNSIRERMEIVELLISSGTARADQLMPGTGLCNLEETLALTRHAHDLGCAAAMVLPPFFYVAASDEGLYRYFSQLVSGLASAATKICLYHIPQNTGIGVSPGLAARLNEAFPEVVTAYKDSSGNWENTSAVIAAAPGISVFPASETLLIKGMKIGAGGCISATCNSNVATARQIFDLMQAGDVAGAEALQAGAETHRLAAQKAGLIGGLKALKAHQSGDARWLNLRAPNDNGAAATGAALAATLT